MENLKQILIQKRFRIYHNKYELIKAQIKNIDFICEGSLLKRWIPCGNPNCHCHKHPKKLHGPYYQLSWKENKKTVSRYLSGFELHLYKKGIDNRHKLEAIINQLKIISNKVRTCILAEYNKKNILKNRRTEK